MMVETVPDVPLAETVVLVQLVAEEVLYSILIDETVLSHAQLKATLAYVPSSATVPEELQREAERLVMRGLTQASSQTAYSVTLDVYDPPAT